MSINILVKTLPGTEVRFASFLSGRFIVMTVINPPEKKLAKQTSVQCTEDQILYLFCFVYKNIKEHLQK